MANRWFLWFWLRACDTLTPIFEPCPLNANIARWWNDHSSSHFPAIEYTDVDHCGLMHLNDLHQTPKVFLNVECHCVKTILLKTRKPFSCHALSNSIVPIHGANVSGHLCCFCPSIELKKKNMSEVFKLLLLALYFLESTAPLTVFKSLNSMCKLKHNSWTSNKKGQSINKPIATEYQDAKQNRYRVMHQLNIILLVISYGCDTWSHLWRGAEVKR